MQGQQVVNALNKGMSLDNDVQHLDNSTYTFSMNGSLIFNKDGTHSWKTLRGNKTSVTIVPDVSIPNAYYKIIGDTGNNNIRVVFLYDAANNNSEIGLFSLNSNGTGNYRPLFNDANDPNGDKLNFTLKNQIEARFLYENPNTIRIYWVDGVDVNSNQPRSFTFKYDASLGSPSDVGAYSARTLSVHAINSQANFNMGLIKFINQVGGGLLSGVYQYSYRLQTNDGYLTPWYPATNRIIVSASAKNATNSNLYEYSQSGLQTSIGNRIQIKGVDQRFDKIDVAYLYSNNASVVTEAKIFEQVDIDSDIMNFEHVSNNGEPLIVEEIPAIFTGIKKAKTLNIKDSTLYYGNLIEGVLFDFDQEAILQNCTVNPIFRDMRSDVYPDNVNSVPLESSITSTFKTRKRMWSGYDEEYDVMSDYSNYDGTQIDHLYPGYWRGEKYRIGIVFYDNLGFQSFVYHIGDIQLPDQFDNAYSVTRIKEDGTTVTYAGTLPEKAWTTNNFGEYTSNPIIFGENTASRNYSHIRIMGIEVNGLDLSTIKNQISGFKIVKAKLDKTILLQGLIMPTGAIKGRNEVRPMPTNQQAWTDVSTFPTVGTFPIPPGITANNIVYNGIFALEPGESPAEIRLQPQVSILYAPEHDFSGGLSTLQSNDKLHIVGGVFGATNGPNEFNHYFIQVDHAFTKYHYTKNDFHFTSPHPYPRYNDKINMEDIVSLWPTAVHQLSNFPSLTFINRNHILTNGMFGFSAGYELRNWGKNTTLLIEHDNIFPEGWTPSTFLQAPLYFNSKQDKYGRTPRVNGAFIVNYKRPKVSAYGGASLSALANTIFATTGHFQPINNPVFPMPFNDIYDNVEVWGGDCWLDYHTQLRLYPDVRKDKPNPGSSYVDYAVGISFPIEMDVNHRLRFSNSSPKSQYANAGSRRARSFVDGLNTNFDTGLYQDRTDLNTDFMEQFNLSSILYFRELTFFYAPKPIDFEDNNHFPVRWRYTPNKFYGDIVDTWRTFQVNDFRDIDGSFGQITSSIYLMNQIYSFQEGAFGRLRASDRAIIESSNAGSLTTGVGDKMDGIDYISTEYGNQHQWSLFKSDNSAYWVDNNKSKIMRFGSDGKAILSDAMGVHQFLSYETPYFLDKDNPVQNNGITGAYDYDNEVAHFIFKRNRELSSSIDTITDLVINSRTQTSNNVDQFVVDNGDTVVVRWPYGSSITNGVVIPFNNTNAIGENNNKYFYIKNNGGNVLLFVMNNGVKTVLTPMAPQDCFLIYRDNTESNWKFRLVDKKEITPQRANLMYNEMANYFVGFDPKIPSYILSHQNKIMSVDYENIDYVFNKIYINGLGGKGKVYSGNGVSIIEIPVNEAGLLPKVFDSIRINCNKYFKNKLLKVILTTDNQYAEIDMATDTRAKYLEDILRMPLRAQQQIDRMRGKHLLVRFVIQNNGVEEDDMLTNILTYFRKSNRY